MTAARHSTGFTVVELMVALSVAAVLLGLAIPAFTDFVRQRTMATRGNDVLMAVTYARSEAARQGRVVSVQAVDASDGDNEWGAGYCVVVGTPGNCNGTVLRRFPAIDDATLDGVGGFDNEATLPFNGRGMLTLGAAGGFELCSNDEAIDPGRAIDISLIGRPDINDLECNP